MLGLAFLYAMNQRPESKWVNEPTTLATGVRHGELFSRKNGKAIGYSLYLPPDYASSKHRYPLILFLHGAGGSEVSDAGPGGFTATFEDVVKAKAFPQAAILFANGRMSFYQDHPETPEFMETHLIGELLPHLEGQFRIGGSRDQRVICGFSMGGVGACRLAVSQPTTFAAAIAWGGNLRRDDAETLEVLRRNAPTLRGQNFRLFLGIGENDSFAQSPPFVEALKLNQIDTRVANLPGIGHDLGAYYRVTAVDAFRFIAPAVQAK